MRRSTAEPRGQVLVLVAIGIAVLLGVSGLAIDVGRVTYREWSGAESERYFANVGSAGMSGSVAHRQEPSAGSRICAPSTPNRAALSQC